MKKLFLLLGIVVFTMSSFTKDVKMEEVLNGDCAAEAWDHGTSVCNQLPRGCSPSQLYDITDNYYQNCTNHN